MSESGQKKLFEDSVNITIYDVLSELVHEFSRKVIKPYYTGGITEALIDLMRKAVQERKEKERMESVKQQRLEEY
jgi:hypothetical protein